MKKPAKAAGFYPHMTLFHAVALLETINTSAGVNKLLTSGVKGMALGANFNLKLTLNRTGYECFTTCAAYD